jgi:hypothetical protein
MHAPGETVVIADREGMVLAATGSAHAYLRLLPDAFEQHLASLFSSADAPRLRSAIRRCGREGGSVDLIFPREAWVLSPCQGGMLSLRLVRMAPQETPRADCPLLPEAECRGQGAALRCDVEDAVTFALHRARSGAEEKRLSLSRGVAYGLAALCDRQAARRIVHLAVQEALADAPRESAIRVDARRVRGIVLLQIASATKVGEEDCDVAVLRSLVEDAGGTLVIDRHKGNQVLSIRLGAADVGKDEESGRADRC